MREIAEIKAERFASQFCDNAELAKLRKITANIALDRLEEICTAEREGRVVVLPCKVGDTVYVIAKCENVQKRRDDDYFTGTGAVECPFEQDCEMDECNDNNVRTFETECTGFMIEDGCKDGFHTFTKGVNAEYSDDCWGKTVFLTRSSAESALTTRAAAEQKGGAE